MEAAFPGEGGLDERHGEPTVRAVMGAEEQALGMGGKDEALEPGFGGEINDGKAGHKVMGHLEVFAPGQRRSGLFNTGAQQPDVGAGQGARRVDRALPGAGPPTRPER